jgi:hypothetical protein
MTVRPSRPIAPQQGIRGWTLSGDARGERAWTRCPTTTIVDGSHRAPAAARAVADGVRAGPVSSGRRSRVPVSWSVNTFQQPAHVSASRCSRRSARSWRPGSAARVSSNRWVDGPFEGVGFVVVGSRVTDQRCAPDPGAALANLSCCASGSPLWDRRRASTGASQLRCPRIRLPARHSPRPWPVPRAWSMRSMSFVTGASDRPAAPSKSRLMTGDRPRWAAEDLGRTSPAFPLIDLRGAL